MVTTLAARGRETRLIDLLLVHLAAGERFERAGGDEVCAVVLGGTIDVAAGGSPLGRTGGRGDVFDGPGDAVYVPPSSALSLVAVTDAAVAVAAAPIDGGQPGPARLIRPADQRTAQAGAGNWKRTVRTVLGPEDAAGRLIVGETINPPGNWSSYPPHKHDRQAPPEEVALEEVYFYRLRPEQGFGVQLLYEDNHERARIVRDGDAVAIRSGYHPVVAAPGYALYYLWVLAGEGRVLTPYFDPRHAWVLDEAGDA
jgi:5-deoxy-glucuronate isomerase